MHLINSHSIAEAWRDACDLIMKKGTRFHDENKELKELMHLIIILKNPDVFVEIASFKKDRMYKWMHENFTQIKKIPELGDAWSYGWRLHSFQGIDQVKWVVEKLQKKPESKAATISMIQGAGTEDYVPCISLLDFKLRNNELSSTVICRSLDFGQKAIHNFINLTVLARDIAQSLKVKAIKLIIHVISAHIYKNDWNNVRLSKL